MFSSGRRIVLSLLAGVAALALAGGLAQAAVNAPSVQAPSVQEQGKNLKVKVSAGAAEVVNVIAYGKVIHRGKKFRLRRTQASVAPLQQVTLSLGFRKQKQERKVKRALNKGKTRVATVTVKLKDLTGSTTKRKLSITLT